MSAVATKIVKKYNLTPGMSTSDLSKYTSELLKDLTDDRKRNQARRRLRDGFKFSEDQVSILIPTQRKGQRKDINLVTLPYGLDKALVKSEETIKEIAQRILRDKLGEKDVKAEAIKLAKSALNEVAGSSRLSRLRKELRNLNAPYNIVEATKTVEITEKSNKIQASRRKIAEDLKNIDYPDHYTLESVKERLDGYDIKTLPDLQALADVMIMLCMRPAEVVTLRITDAGVTGYAKNRGQPDIPRKFKSMEKNQERAKELLTWIQNAISSGQMGNPGKPGAKWFNRFLKGYNLIPRHLRKIGAVYAVVVHGAKNLAHAMTIAGEALRHNPDNHTSPVQNYVVVNYRKRGQKPEEARPFRLYDDGN